MVSPDPLTLSAEALMQQRNQAMTESVKGLFIMNGGGAAALLAFLKAIGTDQRVFATFIVAGLFCLVVGLACAGIVQWFRFRASEAHQGTDTMAHERYYRLYTRCTISSVSAFTIGAMIVVIGALIDIWGCSSGGS